MRNGKQPETLRCGAKQEHRPEGKGAQGWGQTALAGWKPALPGAGKKSTGLTGLYSKGTGRNACRYLRLGNRRGRAENQSLLLGGVGLGRVATSIQAGQAFPPTPFKYRPGGLYLLACRYLCAFTRNALGGGEWGTNRYFLPNKANKSFGINNSSSEEVKKGHPKAKQSHSSRGRQGLLGRFAGRCKSGMASNRKRCDAEQSRSTGRREKEHRPYRPVLQRDRQECLSLPDAVAVCAFTRNAPGFPPASDPFAPGVTRMGAKSRCHITF